MAQFLFQAHRKPHLWAPGVRPGHHLARGLVLGVICNEGIGSPRDRVGGWATALHGAAAWFKRDIRFDGSSGTYLSVANAGGLANQPNATIFLRIRWRGTQSAGDYGQHGVAFGHQDTVVQNIIGLNDSDPDAGTIFWTPSASTGWMSSTTVAGDGIFRNVVVSYTPTAQALYVDGNLEDTHAGSISPPTQDLIVGALLGGGNSYATCDVASVIAWNRVLCAEEVRELTSDPWVAFRPSSRRFIAGGLTTYSIAARGTASILNTFTAVGRGRYTISLGSFSQAARGRYAVFNETFSQSARGGFAAFNSFSASAFGFYKVIFLPFSSTCRGTFTTLNSFAADARGVYRLALSSFSQSHRGLFTEFNHFTAAERGVYRFANVFTMRAAGLYRIANDADNRFELFRGVDAEPDLTTTPYQTFTSLPFTTPSLTTGHVYYFVVRKRNAWGLSSQNNRSTIINTIAPSVVPSNVNSYSAIAAPAGTIQIVARYNYLPDGDAQADTWLIYIRSDGTDPDPSIDTPVTRPMVKVDGVAKLSYFTGAYSEGTVVTAIVRVRHNLIPPLDSEDILIVTATATLLGPAAVGLPEGAYGENAGQQE